MGGSSRTSLVAISDAAVVARRPESRNPPRPGHTTGPSPAGGSTRGPGPSSTCARLPEAVPLGTPVYHSARSAAPGPCGSVAASCRSLATSCHPEAGRPRPVGTARAVPIAGRGRDTSRPPVPSEIRLTPSAPSKRATGGAGSLPPPSRTATSVLKRARNDGLFNVKSRDPNDAVGAAIAPRKRADRGRIAAANTLATRAGKRQDAKPPQTRGPLQ